MAPICAWSFPATSTSWQKRFQFNIKMSSYQYRKSHCGDKTVVRSSYLHNGISYTGKMTSWYWIRAQMMNTYIIWLESAEVKIQKIMASKNSSQEAKLKSNHALENMVLAWWNLSQRSFLPLVSRNFYNQWELQIHLSDPDGPHVGPMNLAVRVWLSTRYSAVGSSYNTEQCMVHNIMCNDRGGTNQFWNHNHRPATVMDKFD